MYSRPPGACEQVPEAKPHEAALSSGYGDGGLGLDPPVALDVLRDDWLLEPRDVVLLHLPGQADSSGDTELYQY